MEKDIKTYTHEQILERKNNLFGLNESALYRIGNTAKNVFEMHDIDKDSLSFYFHGKSYKKCYLKYSNIKKDVKDKKEINDYIFSVTFGEYPKTKVDITKAFEIEREYQKNLEGKLSKIRTIPNYKFDYLYHFDYQDKNQEEKMKDISSYNFADSPLTKYSMDVYEYNGEKYIRVYEYKNAYSKKNSNTVKFAIWIKYEPVTWLVDNLTGIACTLNSMYMPFGTDEFVKSINQKEEKNNIENKNDRIQQILEEIRECLKDYKGDIDIYAKVNELLDNYNLKIQELKSKQNNKISLSLTNEDSLYNELYLNLDNILSSLKFLIKDAEKYKQFLKALKMEETESDIAKEIIHCRDNVDKYNYSELNKDFYKILDDTIKIIENDIDALSNILDLDKRAEFKLVDRIKEFEDKLSHFNGHILKFSDYFDFINLLMFNNKDNKLFDGLYDELNMLKEKIIPELHLVDLTTNFYNLLTKYMHITYESIPKQGNDPTILKNIVKDFRNELLNLELKIKVELSKRENNIDDYQNLSKRKIEVAEASISETYISEIEELINIIEKKLKSFPYELYEEKNDKSINVKENFEGIKEYFLCNKEMLKDDETKLKTILFNLSKIDSYIDFNISNQEKLDKYIIK